VTTNAQFLTLTQWLSPAYPVGAFTYSHGLEAAIADGWITSAETLYAFLQDLLDHGAGRSDATFIAAAYRAPSQADLRSIDATARAFASTYERHVETSDQGAAFSKVTAALWPGLGEDLAYPVALGAAAAREDIPLVLASSLYLQAFVSNLASAAQRLMPLGQTKAQALVKDLAPLCEAVAEDTLEGDLDSLSTQTFLSEITAMRHETQSPRIFRT